LLTSGIERSFIAQFIPVRSLILSIPGDGFYSISCECEGQIGFLADPESDSDFWVNSLGLVVPEASVVWAESRPHLATESLGFIPSVNLSRSAASQASL
jgi:hypothetical protein